MDIITIKTPTKQNTLEQPFTLSGVGIHSGAQCSITVNPGDIDSGRAFIVEGVTIPARAENVVDSARCTTIGLQGKRVSTIEHLMAALAACLVDNAIIQVEGPEIPILDGSALPFMQAILGAGVLAQQAEAHYINITEPMTVESDNKRSALVATPFEGFQLITETQFDNWPQGDIRQQVDFYDFTSVFLNEIASARTFAFYAEIAPILAAGLARGGSLDNVVIITPPDTFSSELRLPGEWWRHKALDVIGDLALVDARIQGSITGIRPGHTLNTRMAASILTRFDTRRAN